MASHDVPCRLAGPQPHTPHVQDSNHAVQRAMHTTPDARARCTAVPAAFCLCMDVLAGRRCRTRALPPCQVDGAETTAGMQIRWRRMGLRSTGVQQ